MFQKITVERREGLEVLFCFLSLQQRFAPPKPDYKKIPNFGAPSLNLRKFSENHIVEINVGFENFGKLYILAIESVENQYIPAFRLYVY